MFEPVSQIADQGSNQTLSSISDPFAPALDLSCTLTLEVPVLAFSVGAMMNLAVGSLLRTSMQHNEDLELTVNGQLVGPVEILVAGDQLAVRLTGIA